MGIIKTYEEQMNEYITILINEYESIYQINYRTIYRLFEDKYGETISYFIIKTHINDYNKELISIFNSTRIKKPTYSSTSGDIVRSIVNELILNSDKLNERISLSMVQNLLSLKGINLTDKSSIHKYITKQQSESIKEINKRFTRKYQLNILKDNGIIQTKNTRNIYHPINRTKTSHIEIFNDIKEFRNKILELTINGNLDLVKEQGLVENLNTLIQKEFYGKYAIVYFKTKINF